MINEYQGSHYERKQEIDPINIITELVKSSFFSIKFDEHKQGGVDRQKKHRKIGTFNEGRGEEAHNIAEITIIIGRRYHQYSSRVP